MSLTVKCQLFIKIQIKTQHNKGNLLYNDYVTCFACKHCMHVSYNVYTTSCSTSVCTSIQFQCKRTSCGTKVTIMNIHKCKWGFCRAELVQTARVRWEGDPDFHRWICIDEHKQFCWRYRAQHLELFTLGYCCGLYRPSLSHKKAQLILMNIQNGGLNIRSHVTWTQISWLWAFNKRYLKWKATFRSNTISVPI